MRNLFVTLVLLVIVGLLMGIVTPAQAQAPEATVDSDPLNVRAQPTKNADVIATLVFKSKYPALSQTVSGYWVKLDIGGTTGWVCSQFIKLNVNKASLPVDDKVVNEDCNGKSKTAKVSATATPKPTVQKNLRNKYKAVRVGKYPDIHYQVIDLETGAVLFQTHALYLSYNDVKGGGFCDGYDRFVAVYHYSGFSWAGVWEVPSGNLLYSKTRVNVYLYSYGWACNPD